MTTVPPVPAVDQLEVPAGTPTQVANPARAMARTILQAVVGLVVVVNIAAGILVPYLNEQTDLALPAWVFVWLNLALAVTSVLIGAVARLMAHPVINALVTRYLPGLAPIRPLQ
jgi:hypothetical protein